jgi:hypothetical protein
MPVFRASGWPSLLASGINYLHEWPASECSRLYSVLSTRELLYPLPCTLRLRSPIAPVCPFSSIAAITSSKPKPLGQKE